MTESQQCHGLEKPQCFPPLKQMRSKTDVIPEWKGGICDIMNLTPHPPRHTEMDEIIAQDKEQGKWACSGGVHFKGCIFSALPRYLLNSHSMSLSCLGLALPSHPHVSSRQHTTGCCRWAVEVQLSHLTFASSSCGVPCNTAITLEAQDHSFHLPAFHFTGPRGQLKCVLVRSN